MSNTSNDTFATRVKLYRKLKGLRQEDLASELGIGVSTVRTWERGTVVITNPIMITGLALKLNVSEEWIRGITPRDEISVVENPVKHIDESPLEDLQQFRVIEPVPDDALLNVTYYNEKEVEAPMFKELLASDAPLVKLSVPEVHFIKLQSTYDKDGNI
jgi:transcriptional regulator with XRE-family HTH domain